MNFQIFFWDSILDQCWTWLDSLRTCCVTHFVTGVLLDNMCNIHMRNGQNKWKSGYKTSGSLLLNLLLPLDFQVKNANLCLVIPGKNTDKNILLVSCHFLRKKQFLDTTGWRTRCLNPGRDKLAYISFVQAIQTGSEAHPSPYSNGYPGS